MKRDSGQMKRLLAAGIIAFLLINSMGVLLKNGADASNFQYERESAPQNPSPETLVSAFFDDMENGTNGWNATGFWHRVWNHTGAPAWNISYSGNYSWWYGQDATGNYDNGSRNYGNLTSPTITVNNYPAFLSFKGYYETETNGTTPDERRIMISVDNGTYEELVALSSDPMNVWNDYRYNLSDFLKPWYDYDLPWDKKGTVLAATLIEEQDRVIAPCILKENGTYKMWYSGEDSAGTYRIFYATSTDGYTWTKYGVVLDVGGAGSGEDVRVYYPSVIKDGNVYKMWYTGYNGTNEQIFYATSPDGVNWTKHGLVLSIGPGSYDSKHADQPWVMKENSIYKMWYKGTDGIHGRIAYATSADGINWTKYGVVLDYGDAYENLAVLRPSVVKMPDGVYRMWYTARNDDGVSNHYRIKSAYSEDGINWTKRDVEIGFGQSYAPDGAGFCSVLLNGSQLKMWYTGIDWSGPEKINLAITNITKVYHNINIRFSFDSIDNISNTYQGWYIDDFGITETTTPEVLSTDPSDGDADVPINKTVTVIFDSTMNTTIIPVLTQIAGKDPGNWTFLGWSSTYRENDTAMWSHGEWDEIENITLRVSGYADYENYYGDPYGWAFTTESIHGVDITPSYQENTGDPGNEIWYNLTIYNTGKVDDTYNLTASGNKWPTTIYEANRTSSISQIRIGVNESSNISVKVSIPSAASSGNYDLVNITATSQNISKINDISQIKTEVPYVCLWFDDMENGTNGWTVTGLWHQVQDGVDTYNNSYSPITSWWYGQDSTGDYDNGVRNYGRLVSPPIDLTEYSYAKLTFMEWYETEGGTAYDQRWIQINDGYGWQNLTQLPDDGMRNWTKRSFNISAYCGNIIQIGFWFDTIDSAINNFRGWYIDDAGVWAPVDVYPPSFSGLKEIINLGDGSSVKLVWDNATDESPPITYYIYRSTSPGMENFSNPIGSTTETYFTDTGLEEGTTYYYVVRAQDANGYEENNTVEKSITPAVQWYFQIESSSISGYRNLTDLTVNPLDSGANESSLISGAGHYRVGNVSWISENLSSDTDISGNWTFNIYGYVKDADIVHGYLYARVYRYNGGNPVLLFQTDEDYEDVGNWTLPRLFPWTYTAPSITVPAGDRIYVEIWVNITSDSSGNQRVLYDYTGVTATSGPHDAYYCDVNLYPPEGTNLNSKQELNNTEYNAIAYSDNSWYESPNPGLGDKVFMWFDMVINEKPENITQINFTFEGHPAQAGTLYIYLYNMSSGAWESNELAVASFSTADSLLKAILTERFGDYVNSSGHVVWGVYTEISNSSLYVDYVSLEVTYNIPSTEFMLCYDASSAPSNVIPSLNYSISLLNITLHSGWNLITLPWQTAPTSIENALSGVSWDRAMVYINNTWYTYNLNRDSRYNLGFPLVDNTIGIWVNCTAPGTLSGPDQNLGNTSIPLHKGWNLVGYPSGHDSRVSDVLVGIPWDYLQTADSFGNIYTLASSDYMLVGKGYWIHVTSDCVWTVPW